jgi:hypothetical protein
MPKNRAQNFRRNLWSRNYRSTLSMRDFPWNQKSQLEVVVVEPQELERALPVQVLLCPLFLLEFLLCPLFLLEFRRMSRMFPMFPQEHHQLCHSILR